MLATLDYAGFPHIFAEVVTHCDTSTQNVLRLLSSDAKLQVDRHQCRYLIVHKYITLDGYLPTLLSRSVPLEMDDQHCEPDTHSPLLLSRTRRTQNVIFALRSTRHVHVVNTTWSPSFGISTNWLSYLTSRCHTLTFVHEFTGERQQFSVPPTVRHLRVSGSSTCAGECGVEVSHTCPDMTIALKHSSNTPARCRVGANAVNPHVERLVLVMLDPTIVAPFLRLVKGRQRHPELCLSIKQAPSEVATDILGLQKLKAEWVSIIDAPIEVGPLDRTA